LIPVSATESTKGLHTKRMTAIIVLQNSCADAVLKQQAMKGDPP
jgi:hypothetical protein